MSPLTEAQKRAKAKYKSQTVKKILLEFYPSDIELYEKVQEQPNKQGYIKELIKKDLKERSFSFLPFFIKLSAVII